MWCFVRSASKNARLAVSVALIGQVLAHLRSDLLVRLANAIPVLLIESAHLIFGGRADLESR